MIRATSADDPQVGQQATIQIEGSDRWLSALVPVHAQAAFMAAVSFGWNSLLSFLAHSGREISTGNRW